MWVRCVWGGGGGRVCVWVCMWAGCVMDRYIQFTIALFPGSFEKLLYEHDSS